jgi:hypothetical protein
MRESEQLEGNRFVLGIKKIRDGLLAIVRLYDQLRPAHVTLAVAWRQTLLLSLDLSRLRKASLIPLNRFWGPAAIDAARLGRTIANRPVRPGVPRRPRAGFFAAVIGSGAVASPVAVCDGTAHPSMSALGHVWTAPWQELSDVSAALVGCGHVSGLLMRPM